jgi:integrase/recombinase XerD
MVDPHSVRFSGPLAAHVDGFWADMQRQGYAPNSAMNVLFWASQFSRWLERRRLGLTDLSEEQVAAFFAHRRRKGYTQFLTAQALAPLQRYLASIGVTVRPALVMETPLSQCLTEYASFLEERSLGRSTITARLKTAREFVIDRFGSEEPRWNLLGGADVTTWAMQQAQRRSASYCRTKLSELRSFLRFLHLRGHTGALVGGVPAVAGWRLAAVPPALSVEQMVRLTEPVPHPSPKDLRDAAIVRLLLRLGLRAGDVAALELEDIDWRAGEIALRGKSRRESRLPVPHDVGLALAAYLRRGRRAVPTRRVFLGARAPYRPLTSEAVVDVATGALRRIGVGAGGAHLLRHTVATQMLRKGASLSDIAQVLRHRHLDTTAIYAKVDIDSLRTLAQPWPGR